MDEQCCGNCIYLMRIAFSGQGFCLRWPDMVPEWAQYALENAGQERCDDDGCECECWEGKDERATLQEL